MNHTLENHVMSITVSDHGAELISIYDKEKEREVLWQADTAFWNRHAPLLFPHVGKYFNDECHYNGKIFRTRQHGFARDMDFSCIEKTKDSITHRLVSTEETRAYLPFDFTLTVTHRLSDKNISIIWEVKNSGQDTMYFTIGGHPAFRVPILPDTKQTDYCLLFQTKADHLNYLLVEPGTGTASRKKVYALPLDHGRAAITANLIISLIGSQLAIRTVPLMSRCPAKDSQTLESGLCRALLTFVWNHGSDDVMTLDLQMISPRKKILSNCCHRKYLTAVMRSPFTRQNCGSHSEFYLVSEGCRSLCY